MKTYFNLNSTTSVESQINSIFNSLSSTLSETSVVVKDRAPKRRILQRVNQCVQ